MRSRMVASSGRHQYCKWASTRGGINLECMLGQGQLRHTQCHAMGDDGWTAGVVPNCDWSSKVKIKLLPVPTEQWRAEHCKVGKGHATNNLKSSIPSEASKYKSQPMLAVAAMRRSTACLEKEHSAACSILLSWNGKGGFYN
eukprot:1158124-Pelagomonas_calceolata.AAC.2